MSIIRAFKLGQVTRDNQQMEFWTNTMRKKPKVGDILEIPLGDNIFAYGQYAELDDRNGAIVRIYDIKASNGPSCEELKRAKLMFPPVIVGIDAAVSSGRWKTLRNQPVDNYTHPLFINDYTDKDGRVTVWWLIDGANELRLGPILPEKYRCLEPEAVWPAEWIEERIRDGTHPFIEAYRAKFSET